MKTLLILSFLVYFWNNSAAEKPSVDDVILETIGNLHKATTNQEVQSCVGKLERIATAEPKRWEAHYYLAYSRIMLSFREENGEKKDAILDQAEADIQKSLDLKGDKSELNALLAYLYQARIQVNAMRGMQYSSLASETLEKAIQLNPSNARAHLLMGLNVYHTPKMFGGGAQKALQHFVKAMDCYEKADSVVGIFPHWGKVKAQAMIEACQKE
jgi:tetratricopeptide (TPR) repeat protein